MLPGKTSFLFIEDADIFICCSLDEFSGSHALRNNNLKFKGDSLSSEALNYYTPNSKHSSYL
jgi:hypothetical protein